MGRCEDYAGDLDRSSVSFEALQDFADRWAVRTPAAAKVIRDMDAESFGEWLEVLKTERAGIFSGDAAIRKFGELLMPTNLVRDRQIDWLAEQFKAPRAVAEWRWEQMFGEAAE